MKFYNKFLDFFGEKILRIKPIYPDFQEAIKKHDTGLFSIYGEGSQNLQKAKIYQTDDEYIQQACVIDFTKY